MGPSLGKQFSVFCLQLVCSSTFAGDGSQVDSFALQPALAHYSAEAAILLTRGGSRLRCVRIKLVIRCSPAWSLKVLTSEYTVQVIPLSRPANTTRGPTAQPGRRPTWPYQAEPHSETLPPYTPPTVPLRVPLAELPPAYLPGDVVAEDGRVHDLFRG